MKALNYCLVALIGLTIITSSCKKDDDKEESITITDNDVIGNWNVTSSASGSGIVAGVSINFIDGGTLYVTGLGSGSWTIQSNNQIVFDFSDADDLTLTVTKINDDGSISLADDSELVYVIERKDISVTNADIAGYWSVTSVKGISSYGIAEGGKINLLKTGSFGMSGIGFGTWNVENNNEVQMVISGTTIILSVIAIENERATVTLSDASGTVYVIEKGSLTIESSNIIGSWELTSLSAASAYGLTVGTKMTFENDGTLEMSGFGTGTWLIQNDDEIKLHIAGVDVIMTAVLLENDGKSISIADVQGVIYVMAKTIIITDIDLKGNWSVTSVAGTSAYGISTATLIEFATGGVLNLSGNMVGTGTWKIQNNNEIALNIFNTDIVMSITSIADDRTIYTFTDPQGIIYVIAKNT